MPSLRNILITFLISMGLLGFVFSFGEDLDIRAGSNILLTPNPILIGGTISLINDPIISGNLTVNGDLLIGGSVLQVVDLNISEDLICSVDGNCNVGNGSNRFGTANFTGVVQAGRFIGNASLLFGIVSEWKMVLDPDAERTLLSRTK